MVNRGSSAMTIRSARRSRTRSRTWRASSTGQSGRTMTNSSPPKRPGMSAGRRESRSTCEKVLSRAVARGVPEDVVQLLEVVEVAVGHRIRRARGVELPDCGLQAPPGHEPSEGVTVGLGPGDLEGAQHRQPL